MNIVQYIRPDLRNVESRKTNTARLSLTVTFKNIFFSVTFFCFTVFRFLPYSLLFLSALCSSLFFLFLLIVAPTKFQFIFIQIFAKYMLLCRISINCVFSIEPKEFGMYDGGLMQFKWLDWVGGLLFTGHFSTICPLLLMPVKHLYKLFIFY